jgi:hypothetical protein
MYALPDSRWQCGAHVDVVTQSAQIIKEKEQKKEKWKIVNKIF